jgi:hypothetical protein
MLPPTLKSARPNPVWAELVQLVPIVSLALPIILAGKIDFSRAGTALFVAALLTVPVSALVVLRHAVLNPILLGTALWLWVAALAFELGLPDLVGALSEAQGAGLFFGVVVVALGTTLFSPQGFIGTVHPDRAWIKRTSLLLLGLAIAVTAWAWTFRHNVRLGGGLPFLVLNIVRRRLILRAPAPA